MGWTHLSNSTIKRKSTRLILNKILSILVYYLFIIPVWDTEVGAKLIKSDIIDYTVFIKVVICYLDNIKNYGL